ncbi:hypothetical protein SALCHL_003344 [Streptomyces albus subsp. chlorinus]|uniref:hypothetical protein n=1 Tax=Streptomyces albus TaxID=1888 RepID=UPI003D0EC79F
MTRIPGETGPPSPGEAARRACSWLLWCCMWPRALYRWARGYGEFHGHFAADCPHRIEAKGANDATPPWNRYRHGKACRRQK